jgi:hypothetical protein
MDTLYYIQSEECSKTIVSVQRKLKILHYKVCSETTVSLYTKLKILQYKVCVKVQRMCWYKYMEISTTES